MQAGGELSDTGLEELTSTGFHLPLLNNKRAEKHGSMTISYNILTMRTRQQCLV